MPALRERKQDSRLLAHHFTQISSLRAKRKELQISTEYLTALENHDWKGNIRELKNCIERSVILSDTDILGVETLPFAHVAMESGTKMLSAFSMASVEKLHIQKVLQHTQGNKAEAARLLEIGIATLYRKIEEYKLN
ncbi:Transcriptional regulatory protein ZraR [compost metagenome]